MASKYSSLALIALAALICIKVQESKASKVGDMVCHNSLHNTMDKITCCDHHDVIPGISEGPLKEWKEQPKDEKENFTMTMWRHYQEMLKKKAGADAISLTKFSELMTAKYPDKLKGAITKAVKTAAGMKDMKWLSSDIKLTDIENLNRLRVSYFEIEKAECSGQSGKADLAKLEINMWSKCKTDFEHAHRDGGCCKGISVPFNDHHHHAPYASHKATTCNTTIAKYLKKHSDKLKTAEDKKLLIDDCQASCFLVQQKIITEDSLINAKEADKLDVDKIVAAFAPTYLSKSMHDEMKKYVKANFKPAAVVKDMSDKSRFMCYYHESIYVWADEALDKYCHPTDED